MSGFDYKPSSPIAQLGGAKIKNGHKPNCACHICENIKNKIKRGGYEEDFEKEKLKKMGGSKKKNGHKPECICTICKNMKTAKKNKGVALHHDESTVQIASKKKRGNGHKSNCVCLICKNIRKKTIKGGDDSLEEHTSLNNETPALDNEYDLEENGEYNKMGGTRKKRGYIKSHLHKSTCGCPICKNMKNKKSTRRVRKSVRRHN
jgi:hypothetical protein